MAAVDMAAASQFGYLIENPSRPKPPPLRPPPCGALEEPLLPKEGEVEGLPMLPEGGLKDLLLPTEGALEEPP